MPVCWECGEPIIFRHVDGVLKPIHLQGGWCSGASNSSDDRPYRSVEEYTNPNAYCPVCGEKVFFYQSYNGGRVFFDNLGWPWPKHPCTDNGRNLGKTPPKTRGDIAIKNREGNTLHIYDLGDLQEFPKKSIFTLRNVRKGSRLDLSYSPSGLKKAGLEISDFWDAPSFLILKLVKPLHTYRVEFISARLGKVVSIRMSSAR